MIALLGAGAIGQMWAYRLLSERPKIPCCFVSTRANPNTKPVHIELGKCSKPLSLTAFDVPFRSLTTPESEQLDPHSDLSCVLICTKSYDAHSAALALHKHLSANIPLVLFQNGMGSQATIKAQIEGRPIFAASTTSGANISATGQLILAGEGHTMFGPLNHEASERGSRALKALHTWMEYEEDIEAILWRKLLINCGINAITAIEDCPNGQIALTDLYRQIWPDLMAELTPLCEFAGVQADPDALSEMILNVAKDTGNNISSMLQDVRKGRNTEINEINGFAVQSLQALGLNTSINEQLIRRVHALGH